MILVFVILAVWGAINFFKVQEVPSPPEDLGESPVIEIANEATNVDLNVLVLEYYPDTDGNGIIDEVTGGDSRGKTIAELKNKVNTLNSQAIEKLTIATRYKGFKESSQAYINYKIIDKKIFDKPVPVSTQFTPFANHFEILQNDVNVCNYIDQNNVKEVWIWMYHSDVVVPIESNMASTYGDVSNSHRQADLPLCNKTYTVYNYNYGRGLGEVLEDHTHQLESIFNWVDNRGVTPEGNLLFWNKFVGSDSTGKIVNPGCGWTHYPPNGVKDYDWMNPNIVQSNCIDWKPDGTGAKTNISCNTWGCDNDGGVNFKVWWMQNLPGYGNQLQHNGKTLRNWWEFKADFDLAVQKGKSLVSNQTAAVPTPTVTPTPITTPLATATPTPTPTEVSTPTPTPSVTPISSPTVIVSPTPIPEVTVDIDFNTDDTDDINDFILFAGYYKAEDCKADLDKDGKCRDIDDFKIFVEAYKKSNSDV